MDKMEVAENCESLFNETVQFLENGEFNRVLEILETGSQEDEEKVKGLITVHDSRNGDISKYRYRYRPIKRKGFTLLHYAMIYGTGDIVKRVLELGADPKAKTDPKEYNVIHCACFIGNLETLEAILNPEYISKENIKWLVNDPYKHTFDDGKESKWLWTPLHYACGIDNSKIVELLIKSEADPFEDEGGVLRYASRYSKYSIVKEMLTSSKLSKNELERKVNQKDTMNLHFTALHYACQKKCEKTVQILLEYGGDPTQTDDYNHTPLYTAISNGSEECATALLQSKYLTPDYVIDTFLTEKSTLLNEAIEQDLPGVVQMLLAFYDPTYQEIKLGSLLHSVIKRDTFSLDDFAKIVKHLGKASIEEENSEGLTPMLLAASLNKHKKLLVLFESYLELLEKNLYRSDKERYKGLYKDIVAKRDKKNRPAVHLAIECAGSDLDFEQTVKVLNKIWKTMKDIKILDESFNDPFVVCDGDGTSALKLALKNGRPDRAIFIIEETKGRTLKSVDKTIIHSAIENEVPPVDFERMIASIIKCSEDSCLDCIEDSLIISIFNLTSENGNIPLHLAMERKLYFHVDKLLTPECKGRKVVKLIMEPENEENTLHVALENSCPRNIIETIMKRLDLDQFPLDRRGSTDPQIKLPLKKGVEAPAVKLIVTKTTEQIQASTLDQGVYLRDLLHDTLEKGRPDIFEMLLVIKEASVLPSTLKKVICDEQNEEYARLLVRHSKQEHILEKLTTVVSSSSTMVDTTFFNELIKKMPDVALEALHRSVTEKDGKVNRNDTLLKMKTFSDGETHEEIPNPLDIMVEHKRLKLLQHPLVLHFLNRKWRGIGLYAYLFQILLYVLFLGSMSALVLTITHPADDRCSSSQSFERAINNISDTGTTYIFAVSTLLFLFLQASYAVIIIAYFHRHKYHKLMKSRFTDGWKKSFTNECNSFLRSIPELWLQIPTCLLSFVLSIASIYSTAKGDCLSSHMWRIGIFAIIFGWTNLIILASKLPYIGEYALVFAVILKTFLKLALFGLLLTLASTIALIMILRNPQETYSPFATFGRGTVKLITMITGELDFQDTFSFSFNVDDSNGRDIYDPNMAYFIWIVFLVIIPILLSNMLTALAVGDVTEIHNNATLRKLELQVQWVTGLRPGEENQGIKCFTKSSLLDADDDDDDDMKIIGDIKLYDKKLQYEKKEIEGKYSEDSSWIEADSVETIKSVKQVTLSIQRQLREIKVVHDEALQKINVAQAHLAEDVKRLVLSPETCCGNVGVQNR